MPPAPPNMANLPGIPAKKTSCLPQAVLFRSPKGQRDFRIAWIGNLPRAATAAAGSGAASDARTRVAPDEHALARAVSGLPARRALTHAPPVCVSLECSSARARRRQEAREWRRENADGTRWRVLVGRRRARARLTPLRCRQRPWRPTEFEQLVSYLRPTPAPRASSTLLLKLVVV